MHKNQPFSSNECILINKLIAYQLHQCQFVNAVKLGETIPLWLDKKL